MEKESSAFKHWINKPLLQKMALSLASASPAFDQKRFVSLAPKLEALELKARVQLVRDQLKVQLPESYEKALKILLKSLDAGKLKGFDLWPYTEFVQTYGLDHPEISLKALYRLTQLFTAEFAVRPFLKKHPKLTLAYLQKCATDKNVHVRRWVSEGTRPRLPWGERLESFVKDPRPTISLLEKLKHDEDLYVRKSVANHLNDISKDHPELLIQVLKKWQKQARSKHQSKINWITRHSLRTLIKKGHPGALALMGADHKVKVEVTSITLQKKVYKLNDKISFEFEVQSQTAKAQKLVIDYVIHHVKANKETSPKVFKLKTLEIGARDTLKFQKLHHLKPITTRKYYPGTHILEIQINGNILARTTWELKI